MVRSAAGRIGSIKPAVPYNTGWPTIVNQPRDFNKANKHD